MKQSESIPSKPHPLWLTFFRLECARAALSIDQSRNLEQHICQIIAFPRLPTGMQQILCQAPLLEIPWLVTSFGVELAAQSFEVTILTCILTAQVIRLEETKILSSAVRACFEYSLIQLLPNTSTLAVAETRERLRLVLDLSQASIQA